MFSAAELLAALQRRLRLVAPHLRRPPGEFPPGWQAWLADMRERPGVVTGAQAESVVAILAQRPVPSAPRRTNDLTRWQAFSTLWRQQWYPPAPEERRWRWFAGAVSVLWHVLFGALLVWLMYLKFVAVEAPPPEGETVVQVEFIGKGAPDEVGGGPDARQPETVEESTAADEAVASSGSPAQPRQAPMETPTTVAQQQPSPSPPVEEVPSEVVEPQPPTVAQQPVATSEPVPDRTEDFVLPPPAPRIEVPALATPELRPATPSVQVVEIPAPQSAETVARPSVPMVEIAKPVLEQPVLDRRASEVAVREIPAPAMESAQPLPALTIPTTPVVAPELRATRTEISTVTIPSPKPSPPAASNATAAAPKSTPSRAPSKAATAQASAQAPTGDRPSADAAGAGPAKTPAAGGWPSTRKADDWGDSSRNAPGGQRGDDGLYNSDGSVRLADAPGSAAPGNPPGTITDEITDLDRAGTWLKRPPIGYEPTTLDKYWRPSETLLAEWVRKSIKTIRIPIPGTNKHIVCQTVLLALGGGCGITDPNLNEQPASARPPPDIPFKPELQEDNGSVRPGG